MGVWTSGTSMGEAKAEGSGGGTYDNALVTAGTRNTTPTYTLATAIFNGSTWASGANAGENRRYCTSGGTPTSFLMAGGYAGTSNFNTTRTYNGTTWSNGGNLGTARRLLSGGGTIADGICAGGYTTGNVGNAEKYNGTSWSSAGTLGTARRGNGSAGSSASAITFGGYTNTFIATSEKYNGSSWSSGGNISTGKGYSSGSGDASSAMCWGGFDGTTSFTTVENYNGTSWSTAESGLATGRRFGQGNSIAAGGLNVETTLSSVELYDVPAQGEVIRTASSNRQPSTNRIARFAPILYNVTQLTIPTYDGSGQAVHPSVVYIPGGFAGYKYWMAMTPYPAGNDDYENPSLLASNDSVTWEVPTGITNPLASMPSDHNSDCCLVWDGIARTLYLYYVEALTGGTHHIYRFPITEGPLAVGSKVQCTTGAYSTGIYAPAIWQNSSNDWVMWFIDVNVLLQRWTSTDGLAWTNQTFPEFYNEGTGVRTKLTLNPWHLSVTKHGDRYLFFMCAYPVGSSNAYTDLYYAIAEDMNAPLDVSVSPLLTEFSGWGTREVYHSSLCMLETGQYRLFISAATTSSVWHIGYADISLW